MGRELVERDDGTWWIVETVTEPKMRISRVFASKAEALTRSSSPRFGRSRPTAG